MQDNSASNLLDRLRRQGSPADWALFVDQYRPLLDYWAFGQTRSREDAADLVQDVLLRVMQKIQSLTGSGDRTLLGWLRTVLLRRWWDICRRSKVRPNSVDPTVLEAVVAQHDRASATVAQEHDYLLARAQEVMRRDFEESTWRACWETLVGQRPVREVAAELGVSVDVVYSARSRVIRRLRSELAGILS